MVPWSILHHAGLASHRRRPLSSTVRLAQATDMAIIRFVVTWCLVSLLSAAAHAQVPLSKRTYAGRSASSGVVLLQVNWGRYWKCGAYENAQLQRLAFTRMNNGAVPSDVKEWEIAPTSKLLANAEFELYAFVLESGQYALSGVRFKVAASNNEVRIADLDSSSLLDGGKPNGGTFAVGPGEIVYIGHIGVDCAGEPTPWRFYVEGKPEFDRYVEGFHKRFPFTAEAPVIFRLLETNRFGGPYALPE